METVKRASDNARVVGAGLKPAIPEAAAPAAAVTAGSEGAKRALALARAEERAARVHQEQASAQAEGAFRALDQAARAFEAARSSVRSAEGRETLAAVEACLAAENTWELADRRARLHQDRLVAAGQRCDSAQAQLAQALAAWRGYSESLRASAERLLEQRGHTRQDAAVLKAVAAGGPHAGATTAVAAIADRFADRNFERTGTLPG